MMLLQSLTGLSYDASSVLTGLSYDASSVPEVPDRTFL